MSSLSNYAKVNFLEERLSIDFKNEVTRVRALLLIRDIQLITTTRTLRVEHPNLFKIAKASENRFGDVVLGLVGADLLRELFIGEPAGVSDFTISHFRDLDTPTGNFANVQPGNLLSLYPPVYTYDPNGALETLPRTSDTPYPQAVDYVIEKVGVIDGADYLVLRPSYYPHIPGPIGFMQLDRSLPMGTIDTDYTHYIVFDAQGAEVCRGRNGYLSRAGSYSDSVISPFIVLDVADHATAELLLATWKAKVIAAVNAAFTEVEDSYINGAKVYSFSSSTPSEV